MNIHLNLKYTPSISEANFFISLGPCATSWSSSSEIQWIICWPTQCFLLKGYVELASNLHVAIVSYVFVMHLLCLFKYWDSRRLLFWMEKGKSGILSSPKTSTRCSLLLSFSCFNFAISTLRPTVFLYSNHQTQGFQSQSFLLQQNKSQHKRH